MTKCIAWVIVWSFKNHNGLLRMTNASVKTSVGKKVLFWKLISKLNDD
jgi:hypothetical protein